jgi:ribonucleoside-triphosphate reductase
MLLTKEEKIEALNNRRTKADVYSRVVGYVRPVRQWNYGKQSEFKDRKLFKVD